MEAIREEIDQICEQRRGQKEKITMLESEIDKLKQIVRKEKQNTNKLHELCAT